jgi:hypothetical protein
MWWLTLTVLVFALLVYGAVVDWRARKRGHRFKDGAAISAEIRDSRRDVRAWRAGAVGNAREDVAWMSHFRRARQRR